MTEAKRIEDEATEWLLRQDGNGWTAEDEAALESWLQADVAHEVAYYRLEYGWRAADRLAALRRPYVELLPGHAAYAEPAPAEVTASYRTFCGT